MYAIVRASSIDLISGTFYDEDGTQHPATVLGTWSAGELAAINVYPVINDVIPSGYRATGWTLEFDTDHVQRHWTLAELPPPPPTPVPEVVTQRQARLALLQAGLLDLVDPLIDAMAEPERSAARVEWEYSSTIRRTHPLVQAIGTTLELTEQQINDLFTAAAEISE